MSVFKRELKAYFLTPLAYVFLLAFLGVSSFWTFRSGFFENREVSMRLFFGVMPVMYVFLVPAMAMRLWAEERRSNSIELLFSLPITTTQAVLGKFFAAWAVLAVALVLTFPMLMIVTYLGDPDWGPIVTGYIGSFLLAGTCLAVGSFFSALTRNQVIAFVFGVVCCGILLLADSPAVLQFQESLSRLLRFTVPLAVVGKVISFQARFESVLRGVLELRDLIFFIMVAAGWLWANIVLLEQRRAA